jgi:hypothetical protein
MMNPSPDVNQLTLETRFLKTARDGVSLLDKEHHGLFPFQRHG